MDRLPHLAAPVYSGVRLTVPAREALERAGNRVTCTDTLGVPCYEVELVRPPRELHVADGPDGELLVRLGAEPPYPHEPPADWTSWIIRGAWLPCPECGAALTWAEAGTVPGWRVCLSGHACLLSHDGRHARRMPTHDVSGLP